MGDVTIARRLLAKGAAADVPAEGHTPLSLARGRNEQEMVDFLSGFGGLSS